MHGQETSVVCSNTDYLFDEVVLIDISYNINPVLRSALFWD
jgi:hypothetical protein